MAAERITAADLSLRTRVERRSRFFFGMSAIVLALVFGGFAPTFFLRPLFDVPESPWYLYVHGAVVTAWYALLVVQTGLVGAGRIDVHRTLGLAGAVLALALVAINAAVVLGFPARAAAGQYSITLNYTTPETVHQIFWQDTVMLIAFTAFVAVAVALRRRPGAHKRLMLFASLAILGPAVGRIANLMPSIELFGLVYFGVFGGLYLAVILYDALTMPKRFHPATLAVLATGMVGVIAQAVVGQSELGRSIVAALAGG
jgi:hypothetical protein